jgi:hypothetical protein
MEGAMRPILTFTDAGGETDATIRRIATGPEQGTRVTTSAGVNTPRPSSRRCDFIGWPRCDQAAVGL